MVKATITIKNIKLSLSGSKEYFSFCEGCIEPSVRFKGNISGTMHVSYEIEPHTKDKVKINCHIMIDRTYVGVTEPDEYVTVIEKWFDNLYSDTPLTGEFEESFSIPVNIVLHPKVDRTEPADKWVTSDCSFVDPTDFCAPEWKDLASKIYILKGEINFDLTFYGADITCNEVKLSLDTDHEIKCYPAAEWADWVGKYRCLGSHYPVYWTITSNEKIDVTDTCKSISFTVSTVEYCPVASITITNVESPPGSGKIKVYGYATGKAGESATFQLLRNGEVIAEKTYTFSSMADCYPTFEVDVTNWSPGSYKLKICACGGTVCSNEVTVTVGEVTICSIRTIEIDRIGPHQAPTTYTPILNGKVRIYGHAFGDPNVTETFRLYADDTLLAEKTFTTDSYGTVNLEFEIDLTTLSFGTYTLKITACDDSVKSNEVTIVVSDIVSSAIDYIDACIYNNDKDSYIDYVTTNEPVRQNFPDIVEGLFKKSIDAVIKAFEWTLDIIYDIGTQFADLLDPFLRIFDRNYAEDFINMLKRGYNTFADWFEDVYTFLNTDSWTGVTKWLYPYNLNTFSKAFEYLVDFDEKLAFTEGMLLLAPICGDNFENWKDVTMTILNWLVESIVTLENLEDYLHQYASELAEAFEKQGISLHEELYGGSLNIRPITTLSPFVIPAVVAAGALIALEIIAQAVGWEVFHLFICEEYLQQHTMAVWNAIHAQDWVAAEKALKNLKGALTMYWIIFAVVVGIVLGIIVVSPFKLSKIYEASRVFKEVEFAEKAQKALQRLAQAESKLKEAESLAKAKEYEAALEQLKLSQAEAMKMPDELIEPYRLVAGQKEKEYEAALARIEKAIHERDEALIDYNFQYGKTKLLEMQYHMSFWQKAGMALLGVALSALSAYVFYRYGLSVQTQIDVYERIITAKTGGKIYKPPEPGTPTGLLKVYTDPAGAFIYVFQDGEWRFAGKSPGDTIILPVGKQRIKLQLVDYRGYMWEKEITVEVERMFTPGIIDSEKITEVSVTLNRVDIVPKGQETVKAKVIQAISGDVLDVETEYGRRFRVKLAGVNAPKLYKNQIYCEQCGAQPISWKDWFNQSANQLNALIQGQTVTLKIDQDEITVKEYNSVTTDEEEMVLAVVYKGDENINVEMIKTGLACADFRFINKFVDKTEFLKAQSEAIASKSGFFSVIQCEVKLINVSSNVYSKLYINDVYMGEGDMLQVSVAPGQHEIILVANGYYALKVTVNVTDSGISCISAEYGTYEESTGTFTKVGEASCDACSTKENGVCISGFTIEAYLKAKEEVTPPPPTPTGYTICNWVNSAGKGNLVWNHVLALYYKYRKWNDLAESQRTTIPEDKRPPQFPDTILWSDILGAYYYYREWYDLGDAQIKCGWSALSLSIQPRISMSQTRHKSLIEKILNNLKRGD